MLYRISAFLAGMTALILLCIGCGGQSGMLGTAETTTSITTDETIVAETVDPNELKSAAYASPLGMELHRLNDSGFPCDPLDGELSVTETELEDGSVEWLITDNLGDPRPVFMRIRFDGTGYGTETIEAGDWGEGKEIIFAPFATDERDLDLGVCPVATEPLSGEDCTGRVLARIVFEPGTERTCSLGPLDRSGIMINQKRLHGFFPFTNPATYNPQEYSDYLTYTAHWICLDQQVEAVDDVTTYGDFERDKLYNAFSHDKLSVTVESQKKVLRMMEPYTTNGEDYTYLRLRFYGAFHGDYNRDGWVNIADIIPVGTNFGSTSNYDAETRAGGGSSIHNPYIKPNGVLPFDPVNFIDGSMDGQIDVPDTEGEMVRLRNRTLVTPDSPEAQYENDLSPIAVHYGESLSRYRIEITPEDPDEEREQYLPSEYVVEYPPRNAGSGPFEYTIDIPLNWNIEQDAKGNPLDDTTPGLDPDTYQFIIRSMDKSADIDDPLDPLSPWGQSTILSNYVLNFNRTIVIDPDPTIAWPTTPDFQADASLDNFRSLILRWLPAIISNPTLESYPYYTLDIHVCDGTNDPTTAAAVQAESHLQIKDLANWKVGGVVDGGIYDFIELTPQDLVAIDSKLVPGANVCFALSARVSDEPTSIATPDLFATGIVSYDTSPPYWTPNGDPDAVDTDDDILYWSYGVDCNDNPGFYVYYGYALDDETGVSGYRLYHSTAIPMDASGTQFSDAQLNAFLATRTSSVIEYPRDAVADDPYWDYLTGKRCFFVPITTASARYNNHYVLVTAFNGEHEVFNSARDAGNESLNRKVINLCDAPPSGLFQRGIISDPQDGGEERKLLNPDYFSGDMACKGWYNGVRAEGDDLVVGHVNEDDLVSTQTGNNYTVAPNLSIWSYESGNPLKQSSWDLGDANGVQSVIKDEFIRAIEIPPDSEISAEWVQDASTISGGLDYDPVVAYQVSAGIYADGIGWTGEYRVYNMGGSRYTGGPDYRVYDYIEDDTGVYSYPLDLTPWSFGYPMPNSRYDTYFYPHFMDHHDERNFIPSLNGFAMNSTEYTQIDWPFGNFQIAYNGRTMMESVVPFRYFEYDTLDWTTMPQWTTIWGASSAAGNTPVLNMIWHNLGDLQTSPQTAQYGVIPGQNLLSDMTPCFASTACMAKGYTTNYTVFTTEDSGEAVLKLAVSDRAGVVTTSLVSEFPEIISYDTNKSYFDLIDCIFGASVLDQQGGDSFCIGLGSSEDSWTPLEQDVEPNEEMQKQPLCVSFIQTVDDDTLAAPQGQELYYGEIYTDEEGSPYMWIELVDDLGMANLDNTAAASGLETNPDPYITNFSPIWCAIGVIDLDEGELGSGDEIDTELDRLVPVICYGVRNDYTSGYYGQLKVACPVGFVGPTPDYIFGQGIEGIYQYKDQPDDTYDVGENPLSMPTQSI